ncbi:hypothetical protein EDD21DRAFT_444138 [Dissophora ornata]|nr:hypothetical protein EDD21DRAFT_444138 [Dissophora ornata]
MHSIFPSLNSINNSSSKPTNSIEYPTNKPSLNQSKQHSLTTNMALFKSSKNQSASAATTPRSSMNEQRRVQVTKLTQDQVLEMLHKKAMPNPSTIPAS